MLMGYSSGEMDVRSTISQSAKREVDSDIEATKRAIEGQDFLSGELKLEMGRQSEAGRRGNFLYSGMSRNLTSEGRELVVFSGIRRSKGVEWAQLRIENSRLFDHGSSNGIKNGTMAQQEGWPMLAGEVDQR